MPGPTASELIFSEQANHNFSRTLSDLKRFTLSIQNRLQSILHDAVFAQSIASAFGRPLVANERCGSWYIDPDNKGGSAYFKSTDGHTGVWKISTRRLNLHLLKLIGHNDGCIIVDSTRRGKRMPDALSKTVPIWCSVFNRILFPALTESHELYTPPQVVSQSEHAQITVLLPSFVSSIHALSLPVEHLRSQIAKPLRPMWITPESHIEESEGVFDDFHPVICCTVSRRVAGGELSEQGYIQGAGDDTENWAHGLTPSVFWANRELLLSISESALPDVIGHLVRNFEYGGSGAKMICVQPTSCLYIAALGATSNLGSCTVVSLLPKVSNESTWRVSPNRLDVGLGPHKLGSRNMRKALPTVLSFVKDSLASKPETFRLLIACETGKDISVGVSLVLLCLLFTNDGKLLGADAVNNVDKIFIRRRLGWVSNCIPDANPSRATLQSANSFLMERP